jgi:hypothetical protein
MSNSLPEISKISFWEEFSFLKKYRGGKAPGNENNLIKEPRYRDLQTYRTA